MATLNDQYISDTFRGILHSDGELPVTGTSPIFDGNGNSTPLNVGRSSVEIDGTFTVNNVTYPDIAVPTTLLDLIYPIGAVFFSALDISPGLLIGGTWRTISQGRFIVGVGSSTGIDPLDIRGFNVGENDGEYTHKLTLAEIPSHTHPLDNALSYHAANSGVEQEYSGVDPLDYSNLITNTGATGGTVGGTTAHNNVPPSVALYIYERIS